MVSRADRSLVAEWWWTIDRLLLVSLVALLAGGVVLSFAASPPVAERLGLESYHFVIRQAFFAVPALVVMIAVSFLPIRKVRRAALILFIVMLVATIATLFFGDEAKGARRWLSLFGLSVQPSEFLKPAFVILTAFLFAEGGKRPELPGKLFAVLLLVMVTAPLVAQPDFGQTMLVAIVWCALFFLAGMPWKWVVALGALGGVGLGAAYANLPHVAKRINRFLDPSSGDTFQVDTAIESFVRGGWFGRGPGEGTVKRILPDSHTDFVFAVTAEEFGVIVCLILVSLFAFVVLRGLTHAMRERDAFTRLAISGLVILFGVQSMINMAVNLHLMPAKGMTLPFVSYGGSSLVAVALEMGFVLALTRRRPKPVQIGPMSSALGERRAQPA
ncbi:putative lipid II flippase FtsW [Amorphus sp. 3PC139-8]|uniref:putative lipid II flippase FtsW n=1 Tax=Amorphus sp. 3PC139-8 TaxID=2735676 RepID=UPI00345D0FDB